LENPDQEGEAGFGRPLNLVKLQGVGMLLEKRSYPTCGGHFFEQKKPKRKIHQKTPDCSAGRGWQNAGLNGKPRAGKSGLSHERECIRDCHPRSVEGTILSPEEESDSRENSATASPDINLRKALWDSGFQRYRRKKSSHRI